MVHRVERKAKTFHLPRVDIAGQRDLITVEAATVVEITRGAGEQHN